MTSVTEDFGWTSDPAILAALKEHICGGDDILTNRKDGGIHKVWTYPLGSFDDNYDLSFVAVEPIWTRVDLAWGRYFNDGCTFLVWEEYSCRAGTLEDAVLFVKGLNCETPRTALRAEAEQARYQRERQAQPSPIRASAQAYFMPGDSISSGVTTTTTRLTSSGGNRAQRRAAARGKP
jgi:hypothetical protein